MQRECSCTTSLVKVFAVLLVVMTHVAIGCGSDPQDSTPNPTGQLTVNVAPWAPAFRFRGGWGAVPVDTETNELGSAISLDGANLGKPISLPAGRYNIYWAQDEDHKSTPACLARNVVVHPNKLTTFDANSGIELKVEDWIPRIGFRGYWCATPPGGNTNQPAYWAETLEAILIMPGTYDVYWIQDESHQGTPLLLAKNVEVADGQLVTVDASSGIQLNVASWVPKLGFRGTWIATKSGADPNDPVHWTDDQHAMLLMPGRYDVYWIQDNDHQSRPMALAQAVLVEASKPTTVDASSGVKLEVADWVPKLGFRGWWGAVPTGQSIETRVNWTDDQQALLLPPSSYDIYWIQDESHQDAAMLLHGDVIVQPGQTTTVALTSGLKLLPPKGADALPKIGFRGWWGVTPAGSGADQPTNMRVHWVKDANKPLQLPPGRYDVYWKQDSDAPSLLIGQNIEVTAGTLSDLTLSNDSTFTPPAADG